MADLFQAEFVVLLYDLTSTYFEGNPVKQLTKKGGRFCTEITINHTHDFYIVKTCGACPALRRIGFQADRDCFKYGAPATIASSAKKPFKKSIVHCKWHPKGPQPFASPIIKYKPSGARPPVRSLTWRKTDSLSPDQMT